MTKLARRTFIAAQDSTRNQKVRVAIPIKEFSHGRDTEYSKRQGMAFRAFQAVPRGTPVTLRLRSGLSRARSRDKGRSLPELCRADFDAIAASPCGLTMTL